MGQNCCFSPARSVLYPTTLSSSRCKKWHGVTARSVLYHFLWQAQYSRKNPSFFHGFERVVPHIVWQAQLKDLLMAGAKLVACCPFAKWEAQFHGETHVLIERCSFYHSAERVVPGTTPSWPVNFQRNGASVLRVVPLRSLKLQRIKETY